MTNIEIATLISERIGDRPVPFQSVRAISLDIYKQLGGTEDDEHFEDIYQILLETLPLISLVAVIDDNDVSTATTWSSSKIVSELANAGFDVQVVQELPATGDAHTLYFVPSADPQTQNIYDEYLYTNNEWEQVGSTAVDLSDYYNKTQVDTLLDDKMSDYYTKPQVNTLLDDKMSDYYNKTQVDTLLVDKAEIVEITQAEYDALSAEEKNNGKIYSITDATIADINNYYTKTEADGRFNPKNTVTSNSGSYKFPNWNANGQITGYSTQAYQASQNINGSSRTLYSTSSSTLPTIYAPTSAGTAGYYLVSNGSGAPVWKELEVASDYVISDADASAGTYSTDIANFYSKTISENIVQGVQIKITDAHIINDGEEKTVYSDSYYLPSSSRIYEGNVELWLMTTEDGVTWENIHYLITGDSITRTVTNGNFGPVNA